MLSIIWSDHASQWKDVESTQQLLTMLIHNPFSTVLEMDIGGVERWNPLDENAALAALQRGRAPVLGLRSNLLADDVVISLGAFETTIRLSPGRNGITALIQDTVLNSNIQVSLVPFLRQISAIMPDFYETFGLGFGGDRSRLYREHGLPKLPRCLNGYLDWYYLLSPDSYQQDYTATDILAAPAYSVHDLGSGLIEMICYAHPLQYNAPESQQRIIELTRYLDAHRKRS